MIEKELGIPTGAWSSRVNDPLSPDQLVRVDISNTNNHNLRMANGNESGANELWLLGGATPESLKEAVIDPIIITQTNQYNITIITP